MSPVTTFRARRLAWTRDDGLRRRKRPQRTTWLATLSHETHFTGEHQDINELATSDVAEGSGVGTALIAAGEQWAPEQGYRILALSTGATNGRALGFYHHLGFRDEDVKLVKLLTESGTDNPNRQT